MISYCISLEKQTNLFSLAISLLFSNFTMKLIVTWPDTSRLFFKEIQKVCFWRQKGFGHGYGRPATASAGRQSQPN